MALVLLASVSSADDAPKERPPVKEPELRSELVRRAKADQDVRGEVTQWMKQFGNKAFADEAAFLATLNSEQNDAFQKFADTMRRVDTENTAWLGEIVDRHGWPTFTLVGRDGANAAWLLVQHADRSPKFQRKCLDLMVKVPRNEVSQKNVAYLTDRVLLAEGKKQRYGTQFILADGKCKPRPIEDEANVDKRRAEVDLQPLAAYLKEAGSFYVAPRSRRDEPGAAADGAS
ncbi:MAG: hypothetical protein K1X57_11735 [Gemmataceae bacterium]|nr:hypothetical protein [Gemmataceae bacterium]